MHVCKRDTLRRARCQHISDCRGLQSSSSGAGAALEPTLPREEDPTKPCTGGACQGADSLPSSCPLKRRSSPQPCSQGSPLLPGAAPLPIKQLPLPANRVPREGRRRGGTCPSTPAANHAATQVSAAPIRHPAERSSAFCTAIPVYQLIKKLGCLPETDDKSLLPPTLGRHLDEVRGLVQQRWPRVLMAASLFLALLHTPQPPPEGWGRLGRRWMRFVPGN